jgi:hypothetical protein
MITRLGEFSPIGRLFSISTFQKNTKVALIYGSLLRYDAIYVLILT